MLENMKNMLEKAKKEIESTDTQVIKNALEELQKVSNEKKKNVYAIFDDGAMIYDRDSGELDLFGHVLKFEPGE